MTELTLTCVICLGKHANTWTDGGPNMYCERCNPIRIAAKGVTDHIVDSLYLADMEAAKTFDGFRMCVHEDGPQYKGQCHFLPVLTKKPNSVFDRYGAVASVNMLNTAADLIDYHVGRNEKLLVHCHGGIERSPLTIAWYLVNKVKRYDTLQEAYAFMRTKRPAVSERLFWLP